MGSPRTAPTAMVCVWLAAVEVLVAVELLEVVLCANAELSKAVENITMLSNIATLFSIS
jgi:hypothetical protein